VDVVAENVVTVAVDAFVCITVTVFPIVTEEMLIGTVPVMLAVTLPI
jgi:hypothetical protein